MAEVNFKNIELVDRKDELRKLKEHLVKSIEGRGSTVFISGEAGIGKTRIVEELINQATDMGFKVIRGQCLPEHIEPFFPFKSALKRANLANLLSNKPPPLVLSAYLISGSGLLISKAEREESNLDPDIFVGMLKAIEAFLKDSMHILGEEENATLNSLSYGDYNIIIRSLKGVSLATVIKGEPNEFLIEDMRITLEKLSDKFRDWDGDTRDAEMAKQHLQWFIKSGKYDGTFPAEEPQIVRENIFDNILLGLQRLSEKNPLIVFIDDLQWADRTTLNFLYYLARNVKKSRILIIGTYRPEEIIPSGGQLHPLEITINNLAAENILTIIGLKRLSKEDTFIFISRILGDFDPLLGDKIYAESNGNPLFIIEIIKLLIYENAIYNDGKKWKMRKKAEKIVVPKHAYELIKRRLERLDDDEREILDVASVVGEEFDVTILSLVTGMDELKILKKLNRIYRKHKLIYAVNGKYRFEHSIIREVLYNELLDELRRKYHRIIGDVIYELNRDNIEQVKHILAHHYYEARDEKAVEFLLEAGNRARRNYANEEAINYFKRVLEIDCDAKTKILALESIGDILSDSGDFEGAEKHYKNALDMVSDPETKARLFRKMATLYANRGEYSRSIAILKQALSIVDSSSIEAARTYREMGRIKFMQGDYQNALENFKKALKLFADKKYSEDIGSVLKDVANVYVILGVHEKARKYYTKALQIMKSLGNRKEIATILSHMGDIYLLSGDIDMALRIYQSSLNTMKSVGYKWGIATIVNNIGNVYLLKGDLKNALQYFNESLEISERIGQKSAMIDAMMNIGKILFLTGKMEKALEHYRRALQISHNIGDERSSACILLNIAEVYAFLGDMNYALKILNRCRETMEKIGDKQNIVEVLIEIGQILTEKGDLKKAKDEIIKAIELSRALGNREKEYNARIVLGAIYREMGNYRMAIIELTKAMRYFKSRNKIKLARIFCEFAKLWAKKGEVEMGKDYLNKAQELYGYLGMQSWADKCKQSLAFFS